MHKQKVSLRQLVADSVSLMQQTFDLPDTADDGFERLKTTRELSDAIELEKRIVKLLCFLDAAKTVFPNASWLNAFNTAIAWTLNDHLAKQFFNGNTHASWDLFVRRLDAFNRSEAKLSVPYSNWAEEYSKGVAERLDPLTENGNEDNLPTWWLMNTYYANARIYLTKVFFEFLCAYIVEMDSEDLRMLEEMERIGNGLQ